jgi:hypothetical protein
MSRFLTILQQFNANFSLQKKHADMMTNEGMKWKTLEKRNKKYNYFKNLIMLLGLNLDNPSLLHKYSLAVLSSPERMKQGQQHADRMSHGGRMSLWTGEKLCATTTLEDVFHFSSSLNFLLLKG